MTHWTKHERRLARDFGRMRHGDEGYAREELVAELGSAFLCADLGITPEVREDHAAYIASWLTVLKGDRRFIFTAASHAQRSADYLHGLQPNASDEHPVQEPAAVTLPLGWRIALIRAGTALWSEKGGLGFLNYAAINENARRLNPPSRRISAAWPGHSLRQRCSDVQG
jgi:hypothetical protein